MSILSRALDEIDSIKHFESPGYSVHVHEADRIVREVAALYEAEIAREKARADAYETIIKNLRLAPVATSGEEEE